MSDITLYDQRWTRERVIDSELEVAGNKLQVMMERVEKNLYKGKFGMFISDVSDIINIVAPDGLDFQLHAMAQYRTPRPYEKQLQVELHKFYNHESSSDVLMLCRLALGHLEGNLDRGKAFSSELDLMKVDKYRNYEIETIYKAYGTIGVLTILKYYIEFWYQI